MSRRRPSRAAIERRGAIVLATLVAIVLCAVGIAVTASRLLGARGGEPAGAALASHAARIAVSTYRGPRWTADERSAVRARLGRILTSGLFAQAGMVVVGADGAPLYARRAHAAFVPASTLKVLVAATALERLGPQHRFETSFVSRDAPDPDGTLHGPLWLVGGGDPRLASDDLRRGVGALVRAGVRRIEGGLVVDDTAFAGPERNPLWNPDDLQYDYAAGASAIALDEGVVRIDVTPRAPGRPADVRIEPPNGNVAISGTVSTVGAGAGSFVRLVRAGGGGVVGGVPERNAFTIGGQVAANASQRFYEPVQGLGLYVGGAARAMLARRGVAVGGPVRLGVAPADARPLWTHRSVPLAETLRDMLVNSNNHTAEQLLRLVGEPGEPVPPSGGLVGGFGRPASAATTTPAARGTAAAGVAAERAFLATVGVPTPNFRVYDGSGLSPSDRLSALTEAELLAAIIRSPLADAFMRALPLAGKEGTVKYHALGPALGRVRAKSGHIDGVNGLAGVVQTRRHGRIAFAFLVNGPNCNAAAVYDQEDRALDALSEF